MVLEDILYFGPDAQKKLKAGINKLAKAVKVTMGPGGRFFLLGKNGKAEATKDGVSVAKYITLVDPVENMGAEMLKSTAEKTVKDAGDGTTTATVLASELINTAPKSVINVTEFTKGMKAGLKDAKDELENLKIDTPNKGQLYAAAYTSANGDEEIAQIVAESVLKVGEGGTIEAIIGHTNNTICDITEGYKFNQGYNSSVYVNIQEKGVFEKKEGEIFVLLIDGKLEQFNLIVPILKHVKQNNGFLVLIAEDFSADVQHKCLENYLNYGKAIIPIKAAEFGERRRLGLEDLAIYLNEAKVHTIEDLKSDKVKILLGTASYIRVSQEDTIIRRKVGDDKAIKNRIKQLRTLSKNANNIHDAKKLNQRISQLSAGYAVIKVGATTELEAKERKDRYDDAIGATHAALKEGILPGGGVALYNISNKIYTDETGDFRSGYECVRESLKAPLKTILENADIKFDEPSTIKGINAKTGKKNVDMIKEGIIDPYKVTISALSNAVSIASLIISTGGVAQTNFIQTQD